MRTMIVSDWTILRPTLLQWAAISIFVAVALGWGMDSMVAAAAAVTGMVPFMLMFNLAASDEQNGWDRFRLTLPITRRQVVFGRYASLGVTIVATVVFVLALSLAYLAVASLLPSGMLSEGLAPEGNPPSLILFGFLVTVFVIMLALDVTLPLIIRFGITRAIRIIPIVVVIGLSIGLGFLGPYIAQGLDSLVEVIQWLDTGFGYVVTSLALVAIAVALYIASAFIAAKLYERREF